jgi:hypothetical protein
MRFKLLVPSSDGFTFNSSIVYFTFIICHKAHQMVEFLAKGVKPGTRMSNGDHALFANAQSTTFAEGPLNLTNYLIPEICGFAIFRTYLRSAHQPTKSFLLMLSFPPFRFPYLNLSSVRVRQIEVLPR